MAETVKGVNITKVDAAGGPQGDNAIGQGLVNSQVEVWTDTYEASALETASTIDVAELPPGAKVISAEVYHDALQTDGTLALGDDDDPDRYIAAAAVSSAGKLVSNLVDGALYVIGTNALDNRLQLLTGGVCTGTIKVIIYFTR